MHRDEFQILKYIIVYFQTFCVFSIVCKLSLLSVLETNLFYATLNFTIPHDKSINNAILPKEWNKK
jgi:hypothetical protein